MMFACPDHVVVRFVAEDRDVSPAHQIREPFEIALRRHPAGRVVRAVQEDRPSLGILLYEVFHIIKVRTELARLLERRKDHLAAAPLDVWAISREMRTEDQDRIARIKEGLAKKLLE